MAGKKKDVSGYTRRSKRGKVAVGKYKATRYEKNKKSQREHDPSQLATSLESGASLDEFDELMAHNNERWAEELAEQEYPYFTPIGDITQRSEQQVAWLTRELAERPTHLPSATGILQTADEWRALGGRLRANAKGVALLRDKTGEIEVWLYDFADVKGIDAAELLSLPPSTLSRKEADHLSRRLHDYAKQEGLAIESGVLPHYEPYRRKGVFIPAAGCYVFSPPKIVMSAALPKEHQTLWLPHELCHARDAPLHSRRLRHKNLSVKEQQIDEAESELVAALASSLVLEDCGVKPLTRGFNFAQFMESNLRARDHYDDKVRNDLCRRVLETAEHLQTSIV